mgnify:CR=1 FL=1
MATPAQRTNTWMLDEWYDQAVAGTQGTYAGEGELWVVGYGQGGRLGQNEAGPSTRISSPAQIPGTTWITTATTASAILSIKTDGSLWAWGKDDDHNPLGLNSTTRYSSPTQVGTDTTWSYITAGAGNAGIVGATKTDGTLWSWGRGEYGILGHNDVVSRSSPTQVPGTDWDTSIGGIAVGEYGFMGLKTDGALYCWGRGPSVPRNGPTGHVSSPVLIASGTSSWAKISSNPYMGWACIRADGTLWTAGGNQYGALGQGNNTHYSSPKQVGTDTTWDQVGSGDNWRGGIKTDGTLWVWGSNPWGTLGLNQGGFTSTPQCYSSPKQVGTDTTWNRISFAYASVLATKTDGSLWTWGANYQGARGLNTAYPGGTAGYSSPTQLPGTWNIDNSRSLMTGSFSALTKFS